MTAARLRKTRFRVATTEGFTLLCKATGYAGGYLLIGEIGFATLFCPAIILTERAIWGIIMIMEALSREEARRATFDGMQTFCPVCPLTQLTVLRR